MGTRTLSVQHSTRMDKKSIHAAHDVRMFASQGGVRMETITEVMERLLLGKQRCVGKVLMNGEARDVLLLGGEHTAFRQAFVGAFLPRQYWLRTADYRAAKHTHARTQRRSTFAWFGGGNAESPLGMNALVLFGRVAFLVINIGRHAHAWFRRVASLLVA